MKKPANILGKRGGGRFMVRPALLTTLAVLAAGRPARANILQWDSTANGASWASNNWYDVTASAMASNSSTTAYNTLNFIGTGTNSTVAPATMSIGGSTSFASLTFSNGFNSTNTTTISNTSAGSNYIVHVGNGGSIPSPAAEQVLEAVRRVQARRLG